MDSNPSDLVDRLDTALVDWVDSLSNDERRALREYQGNGHRRINDTHRDPRLAYRLNDAILAEIDRMTEYLDEAIERCELPFAVTVFRGIREYPRVIGDLATFTDKEYFADAAFVSTTLDVRSAYNKVRVANDPAIFEIDVPPGQRAAWLHPISAGAYQRELELLLPRRTTLRVRGVADYRGIPMIQCDVAT